MRLWRKKLVKSKNKGKGELWPNSNDSFVSTVLEEKKQLKAIVIAEIVQREEEEKVFILIILLYL